MLEKLQEIPHQPLCSRMRIVSLWNWVSRAVSLPLNCLIEQGQLHENRMQNETIISARCGGWLSYLLLHVKEEANDDLLASVVMMSIVNLSNQIEDTKRHSRSTCEMLNGVVADKNYNQVTGKPVQIVRW